MDGNESTEKEQQLYRADRESVLAAVQEDGLALYYAAEECRADHEIVLAAVKSCGVALQFASEECKSDREIVLAAVKKHWVVVKYAAEQCKADREILQAAVRQNPGAIHFAADELLLDSTFAPEAKSTWYILKVSMLSGRSAVVMSGGRRSAENFIGDCCRRLSIRQRGTEKLVHGTEVLPATAIVSSWPGLQPKGQVSEYQLVVEGQSSA